ncbi:MAG: dienelactone hydrolase family protein [Dongiaceae bacterium]
MTALARRTIVTSIAGLPLATILADPRLAAMAAESLETVSQTTPGGREVVAALAVPAKTPAPAVLLIHEWWGLNDQIKTMAAEFAKEGFLALAVDVYEGQVATDAATAESLMKAVDPAKTVETLGVWTNWLKSDSRSTGKIGTIGWCFGGGWSLNASIANPIDATVIYYGRVDRAAEDLKGLNGPVLGQFAEEDQWINKPMVEAFEANMQQAGKSLEVHWYAANHAFANPTGDNYDKEDAQTAWQRTLEFLRKNLA